MRAKRFSDLEVCTMIVHYTLGKCSREIGKILGRNPKVVQTWAKNNGMPRPKQGGAYGEWNGSYIGGFRIDKNGYREVLAPKGHPYAKQSGYILEHRLVAEQLVGRYVQPNEVVHHKDGDRLNNTLENLQVFSSNAEHLKEELAGRVPNWSSEGIKRIRAGLLSRKLKNTTPRCKGG
jgi:hypothetical protein